MKKNIFFGLKKIADKQLNDTLDGRCLFLCYQPDIPKKLIKNKKSSITFNKL